MRFIDRARGLADASRRTRCGEKPRARLSHSTSRHCAARAYLSGTRSTCVGKAGSHEVRLVDARACARLARRAPRRGGADPRAAAAEAALRGGQVRGVGGVGAGRRLAAARARGRGERVFARRAYVGPPTSSASSSKVALALVVALGLVVVVGVVGGVVVGVVRGAREPQHEERS